MRTPKTRSVSGSIAPHASASVENLARTECVRNDLWRGAPFTTYLGDEKLFVDYAGDKAPRTMAMALKIRQGGWRSHYRLRKQIVEPVFGQIKSARGFRQFLLRGLKKAKAEWAIICSAHNLLKLHKAA